MSAYRLLGDAFSSYFFERVLFNDPKLSAAFRGDVDVIKEARRRVREARKTLAYRATPQSTESQLLRPLAELAGWDVATESAAVETLHGSEDGGYAMAAPDGVIWARAFCAAPDDDLDATPRGRHRRMALSSTITRVLETTTTPYALAMNRNQLRLMRRAEGGTASAIVFDLDALSEWSNESERAWQLLFGLTAPLALAAPLLLERVVERGRREMVGVGDRLGRQVLEAVDVFARSLYANERNRPQLPAPGDEAGLAVVYGELLRVLYRCLFALFAEARGLVPIDLPLYRDNYALSTAHTAPKTGMAERVRALFALLRRGADLGGGERIPPFGGALFAPEAASLVESLEWNDDAVAAVITKLTRVETARGQIPVSYRELDEERLGSIYERLLELRLSVADRTMERIRVQGRELVVDPASLEDLGGYEREQAAETTALPLLFDQTSVDEAVESDVLTLENEPDVLDEAGPGLDENEDDVVDEIAENDINAVETPTLASTNGTAAHANGARAKRRVIVFETIAAGTPYLASSSGRKETASYYTARDLVDFLVRETIDPQAERAEPAAILRLRVVDPAMGSGHFLIGAMRRLADHLLAAYRRSEEQHGFAAMPPYVQATWEDERELLTLCRQLVAVHCLYGVDKNPLAVDLARVALWLATAAADHPLSFLDHRLRCGDSLLGLDVAQVVALGTAAKAKRKRGASVAAQYKMLAVGEDLVDEIALEHAVQNRLVQAFLVLRGFLAIVDDEREPFELKRQRADAVRAVLQPLATLHAARVGRLLGATEDEGTTAFIAALRSFSTFGYLADRDRSALEPFVARGVAEGAFCWQLEFPDAYYTARQDGSVVARDDAGFDVVLGNPPWDKMKIEKRAFYARYDPLLIDYQGRTADARIAIVDEHNESASRRFNAALTATNAYVGALTASGIYTHQSVIVNTRRTGGDPDTFKYFLERDWSLARIHGSVGVVIPAAFTSGDGTTGLRRLVLEHARLRSLLVFENRRRLFPIDSRFKFQTLVFDRAAPSAGFEAAFWLHDTELLHLTRARRAGRTLSLAHADVRRASPNRLAILEVRSAADLQIARRMLDVGAPLAVVAREWGATFGREFDMSQDRKLFHSRTMLFAGGARRVEDAYIGSGGERYVPLREGRMVQAFDGNAKRYVSGEGRSAVWSENSWPKSPIEPHYWVRVDQLDAQWTRSSRKLYWCDVTGATNERTAMAAVVPGEAASGHSLAAMYFAPNDHESQQLALVVFNSFVFDWYVRLSVAQHMSFNFVEPAPFVRAVPLDAFEAAVVTVCSPTIDYTERADRRAELDAAVALAYELSYAEFAHILATFPLLDRAEPPLENEVRSTITRDLALAAYSRLASEHDPEHADRVRAARASGALGYVATPLRAQLPGAHRRRSRQIAGRA